MGMTDFLKKALLGVQHLHGGVREVRSQIEATARDLEDVRCAPTCRADVKRIYGEWIDSRAEHYQARLLRQLGTMLRKPHHFSDLESQTARTFMSDGRTPPESAALAAIALVQAEAVILAEAAPRGGAAPLARH